MAYPLDALAEELSAIVPDDVSVIVGPKSQIKPPALVMRPDSPWLVPGPGYCIDEQRYVAIAVVTASTPDDGARKMYAIVQAVKAVLGNEDTEGWSWESVSAPVIDETTGTPLLAASIRMKYQNSEE